MSNNRPKPPGTGGLYLPLNQKLGGRVPKYIRQGISTLLARHRGAQTPKPADNIMPHPHHIDEVIKVVQEETARLLEDLEAIKQDLIDNPPQRNPVGKPKGGGKKKIEKSEK